MNQTSIEERVERYVLKTEEVLKRLKVLGEFTVKESLIREVIDEAKRYFEDAKYYLEMKEYDVSLASISYCEGLLDALRILKLVEFEW
ncbi:MAG: DUF357 domain-containing protein [Candidatus Bathyarchaeia archaeon]